MSMPIDGYPLSLLQQIELFRQLLQFDTVSLCFRHLFARILTTRICSIRNCSQTHQRTSRSQSHKNASKPCRSPPGRLLPGVLSWCLTVLSNAIVVILHFCNLPLNVSTQVRHAGIKTSLIFPVNRA